MKHFRFILFLNRFKFSIFYFFLSLFYLFFVFIFNVKILKCLKKSKKNKFKIYFVSFFYFAFQIETIFILTCKMIAKIETFFYKKNLKLKRLAV